MGHLVSIIIPTYNRAHLIGETLDSVIAQTFQNWECIVVDDGSTDYIDELLEFYCERDPRIQHHYRPEHRAKGANACRNFGFEISKGIYIQWLDSDDILDKEKISTQIKILNSEDEMIIATCKFGYFNSVDTNPSVRENVKTYQNFYSGEDLLLYFGRYKEYLPLHVYLTSKEIINQGGPWNEKLDINQDGEFFSRVLLKAKGIKFCEAKVFYRVGNIGTTSTFNNSLKAQKAIDSWKIIQENIGKKDHLYIKHAKQILYKKLHKKYPDVIRDNFEFFKKIIPLHKKVLMKFLY